MFVNRDAKTILNYNKSNNNNNNIRNLLKYPVKNINNKSRNNNNNLFLNNTMKNNSIYSTIQINHRNKNQNFYTKNSFNKFNEKNSELDDTISQISNIINKNKKDLNFSGMIGKIPGINDKPNFVYDQILFNKHNINKAKILSHKIAKIKLPISVGSKTLLDSSISEKTYFSKRIQKINDKKKENESDDHVSVSCCFSIKRN